MKRWLVLTIALGVAAVAGLTLLTGRDIDPEPRQHSAHAPAESHHAEIDQKSRDQLRAILRDADRDEDGAP